MKINTNTRIRLVPECRFGYQFFGMGNVKKYLVSGFSLVELMVTLVVLGVLLGLGMPSFTNMVRNMSIRSTAEGLSGALQFARTEAIRTNGTIVFQLMNALDGSCNPDTNGKYWAVSLCPAAQHCADQADRNHQRPANGCDGNAGLLLAKGELEGSSRSEITIPNGALCYSSLGRIDPAIPNCPEETLNPNDNGGKINIEIKSTQDACVLDGGEARCLRITIGPGGESRLCDPAVTDTNDPRKC